MPVPPSNWGKESAEKLTNAPCCSAATDFLESANYKSACYRQLLSDETLHPDVVAAGREAYSLAITHVCFHESEYSHVNPRSIGGNLAKLIACRINLGERDPRKIRDGALTELQLKK